MKRTPIRGLFHHAINAAEAGTSKPAPDRFLKALARVGVEPWQALHLGDDPRLDIAAAREVGYGLGKRQRREWPPGRPPAESAVGNLEQLLARRQAEL